MTEMVKTFLFVAAAVGSLIVAFAMGPSTDTLNVKDLVGLRLNQFEVDVAKRLKIVKFDQETAQTREFEVAESNGLWTIPSKQGYPADAAQQMGEAATCLIDREVLRVAGKSANDHEALGVIDPGASNLDSKAQGIGTRVTITDSNDTALVDMIIGKPVKDADGQYHVRNADQDVVYVVSLDPKKLSTKFEDWIEDDLLKMNPRDIRQINIKDYSAELQPVLTGGGIAMQVNWDRRGEITLGYDPKESAWTPESLQEFDTEKKELVAYQMGEDEQLDEDALSQLRDALVDLILVDVERKPKGLSAGLKAGGDFLKDQNAATSLMERGFAPISGEPGAAPEILSTEGEIVCTLQDGVEYVLRFGNLQLDSEGETSETSVDTEGTDDADSSVNRYLFVMARFNEDILEKPELAELPELPNDADNEADEESKTEEESTEEKAEGDEEDEKDEELASLLGARKIIEKENQRRLDEHQDKIETGQLRVTELNTRFGDWYYVISNNVYKKIHLSRAEVLTKKEKESEENSEAGPPTGGIPGLPNLPLQNGS